MIEFNEENTVGIQRPAADTPTVPLLFDSPHSGRVYPDDFHFVLPHMRLRRAEDAFVDDLFSEAPKFGAASIDAKFPRSYLDPNRSERDFSPDDLADSWTGELKPSEKAEKGTGLIWVRLHGLTDIYAQKLTSAQLLRRTETCWRPYHNAVRTAYDDLYGRFGRVYHLNCHSMRSVGNIKDPDGPVTRPDFVLSDRDGTTCEPGFANAALAFLKRRGYSVQVNFPMKGFELVRRYSDPAKHRHSMQIEINRRLYLDEDAIEKLPEFDRFKTTVTELISTLAGYAANKSK